jgi:hypothetical protein
MTRPEKRYNAQFRIVITQTMKTRLECTAKREGIPQAEFARRALQESIDRVTAKAKRQAAQRKRRKRNPRSRRTSQQTKKTKAARAQLNRTGLGILDADPSRYRWLTSVLPTSKEVMLRSPRAS